MNTRQLFAVTTGRYKNLLLQNEAGSQEIDLLKRKISNLSNVIVEKTRDDGETKTQSMGLVGSHVLNSVDARNSMSI